MNFTYWNELRTNWRALVAAAVGMGAGLSVNTYISGIFAPHLIEEFGWSKADFALIGTVSMLTLVSVPIMGRLADLFGVRRVAAVGVVSMPLSFLAISTFDGSFAQYIGLFSVQLLLGTATTAAVYSRLVAERVTLARGFAFAIVTCGPALVGTIGSPLLNGYIDEHGWRAGYRALAFYSALSGALALALIPDLPPVLRNAVKTKRSAAQDYQAIVRTKAFWILATGMLLCNLPQTLQGLHLKLMLADNGVASATAAAMMSAYGIGVILGRIIFGLSLDRLPPHWVAAVGMGFPCIGMFLIASTWDNPVAIGISVLLIGLSQGAEGDIMAYLVARYFGVKIYSTVFGLIVAVTGIASGVGALLLSISFRYSDSFAPFVLLTGLGILAGSALFLLLGRVEPVTSSKIRS